MGAGQYRQAGSLSPRGTDQSGPWRRILRVGRSSTEMLRPIPDYLKLPDNFAEARATSDYFTLSIPAGKTLVSVTLPHNPNLAIFAPTMV